MRGGIGLHIGSGTKYWNGWVNIDVCQAARPDLVADANKIPLPDASIDVICAIHLIEHFYEWEASSILSEWKRLLKPGGKLVLELPCLDKVIGWLATLKSPQDIFLKPAFGLWPFWGDPQKRDPLMAHKWGYTICSISQLLATVGFKDVVSGTPRYHVPRRDMRIEATK